TYFHPQSSTTAEALGQQVGQECGERRVRAHRGRAHIGQATGQRCVAGLDVEIVEHLDVVTQKSNRGHNDVAVAFSLSLGNGVINVRLEPRERCARGLTLVCQTIVLMSQPLGSRRGSGGKLPGIGPLHRHGLRNGMRSVNECSALRPGRIKRLTRLLYGRGDRLNKAWMSIPGRQVRNLWSLTP